MVVPASLKDLHSIMSLIQDTTKQLHAQNILQWDEIYPTEERIREDIENKTLYKIEIDGRISSIIVLNEVQHKLYKTISWEDADGRPVVVHRLCVHPDFQRQGLARKLMNFAAHFAKENGYTSIRLEAFVPNIAACRLYETIGYTLRGKALFRRGWFNCYERYLRKNNRG